MTLLGSSSLGPVSAVELAKPANTLAAAVSDVVINELDADQTSTDSAEFIEIYDGGAGSTALDGLVLVLFNGSDDASYSAFDLDGQSTDVNGYFVLCGNAANVANCDLDVSPDTNLIQNGADAAALYVGDASDFPNGTAVTDTDLVDAIVYDTDNADDTALLNVLLGPGQPQVNEGDGGSGTTHSNQRCPNGAGGQRNTSSYTQASPTSGTENDCPGPVGSCGDPATPISAIQGITETSPMVGATDVIIEGVVVGDFQGTSQNGFYVQEEDADADGNPQSSEGIFVYNPGLSVNLGDTVRVLGDVTEYISLTEITNVDAAIVCTASVSVTAAALSFPFPSETYLEQFEGMKVTLPQTLTVSENYYLGRYGEVVLSCGRLMNPTNVVTPGTDANDMQAANDLNRIILDDGDTGAASQNPDPIMHPSPELSATNTLRSGDIVADVVGVLSFGRSAYAGSEDYRIHPLTTPRYDAANPRPSVSAPASGTVRVASLNLLNYFTTLGSRGADTAEEFTRQRTKIITAIVEMDADVIGLIEIENHATDDALDDLVSGLNDATAPGSYAKIDTGSIGTDAIKVAFIYKTATVTPTGSFAILDSSVDATFVDTKNRPALAQTFEDQASDEKFTVVVNHLKSKGSDCNDVGDPDTGDGQGNCNQTRTSAATALANWLATDPTSSGDPDFLIIGDLNAYAKEDPITALKTAGYIDLVEQFMGQGAYSYVFDGQAGYLDHALANGSMTNQVEDVTVWHVNADEPSALDYDMTFKSDRHDVVLYSGDAYRSSDHDPAIIDLDLGPAYQIYLPLIFCSFSNP